MKTLNFTYNNREGLKENFLFSQEKTIAKRGISDFLYEKANHLGNVRAVVGGRKKTGNLPDISLLSDQYAFGMPMPARQYLAEEYRFGFNGERDNEMKGSGNSIDFGDRMNDTRLGRWFSTDRYHQMPSSYSSMGNSPVLFTDNGGNFVIKGTDAQKARLRQIVSMAREMLENDAKVRNAFLAWSGYESIDEVYAKIFDENAGPTLEFADLGKGTLGYAKPDGTEVFLNDAFNPDVSGNFDNLDMANSLYDFYAAWTILHEGVHVGKVQKDPTVANKRTDNYRGADIDKLVESGVSKGVVRKSRWITLVVYKQLGVEPGIGFGVQAFGDEGKGISGEITKEVLKPTFINYIERRLAVSQTSQFNQQLQLQTQDAAMKTINNISGLPKTVNPVDIPVQSGVIPGGVSGSGINIGGFGGGGSGGGGSGGAPSVPLPSPKGGPMFQ